MTIFNSTQLNSKTKQNFTESSQMTERSGPRTQGCSEFWVWLSTSPGKACPRALQQGKVLPHCALWGFLAHG